jgi:arylsulfatase A-like enzyme
MHDGGIRVPMIVRWPGRVAAGAVSNQVWAFWDMLPTLAELAGAPTPAGLDGLSMVHAIVGPNRAGRTPPGHEFLYWEFHEGGTKQAVRMGDWKAIRLRLDGPLELYDLTTDLGETHDLAAAHPDVVARIETYLKTARTDSPDFPVTGPAAARPKRASR